MMKLGISGTGRKSMYTLFKELINTQDKDEFVKILRDNRVPEDDYCEEDMMWNRIEETDEDEQKIY